MTIVKDAKLLNQAMESFRNFMRKNYQNKWYRFRNLDRIYTEGGKASQLPAKYTCEALMKNRVVILLSYQVDIDKTELVRTWEE